MKIDISPRLISSIVSIYLDIYRVFMEFIDNSLDASEEFFDKKTNTYRKEINIQIRFIGKSLDDFFVEIEDNCKGIRDLNRVIRSIGNSNKKEIQVTNGQFGFGMYSFIALCDKMIIRTCIDESDITTVEICRNIFEKDKLEDTEVYVSTQNLTRLNMLFGIRVSRIGTIVRLENFDKYKYKQINLNELINEIEKHFELLLRRQNLKITVTFPNGKVHLCKPFDYDKYEGEVYFNKISKLKYTSCKKTGEQRFINIDEHPVTIFLKVAGNKTIDRRPFFVIKGRRITEISDVKAFRTNSKIMIWSHPNVSGYIDVTGCLEPTLARNEFVNNKIEKALFNTLIDEESKIKAFVDNVIQINMTSKFKKLESILENTLNDVNKEFSISNRKKQRSSNDLKYLRNEENDNYQSFTIEDRTKTTGIMSDNYNSNEQDQLDARAKPKKKYMQVFLPSINISNSKEKIENGLGFNISIDCTSEPPTNENNEKIRSMINGNQIIIYQKHPEFESRLDISRDGIPRLCINLIHYLCSEILVNYKLLNYTKEVKEQTPKTILNDFTESLYSFERKLQAIEGRKLSDFN